MSDEFNEDVMKKNVQLVITLNNELVKTINNLQKINNELCKMVSNIGNVSFMINSKIDEIQEKL